MTVRHAALLCVLLLLMAGRDAGAQAAGARTSSPIDAALVAQERSLYEALKHHDPAAFNAALGGDFVFVDGTGAMQWKRSMTAAIVRRCTLGEWKMANVQTTRVGPSVTVVTYEWTADETCRGRRSPSPVQVMSVWRRSGGRWVAVSHSETPATPAS